MFRIGLFLGLLSLGSSFLYTNSRCHEGPAYWCSSEEVAESCQALQYCQDNIWGAVAEPEVSKIENVGNFVTCKACTWAFTLIDGYIFTDANEQKVVNAVVQLCDHVPTDYVDRCKVFIKAYGKQAIIAITAKIQPTVICQALGQCDAPSTSALLMTVPKAETCGLCKTTMARSQQDNDALLTWWQDSCSDAQSPEGCVEYSEYFKLLNKAILNEYICEEMDMC